MRTQHQVVVALVAFLFVTASANGDTLEPLCSNASQAFADDVQEDAADMREAYVRACAGISHAKKDLGLYYLRRGNYPSAYRWFLLAVNSDFWPAKSNLEEVAKKLTPGQMSAQYDAAADWLEANAKLGNLYAQFEAGKLYLSGAGKINRVKGFGWLIVAEHNMKILGNCCASLQEEIEHTLEHAGSLLTSSEQKQAFDFAEQYLKGFDGCQERNGSGRANRQGI